MSVYPALTRGGPRTIRLVGQGTGSSGAVSARVQASAHGRCSGDLVLAQPHLAARMNRFRRHHRRRHRRPGRRHRLSLLVFHHGADLVAVDRLRAAAGPGRRGDGRGDVRGVADRLARHLPAPDAQAQSSTSSRWRSSNAGAGEAPIAPRSSTTSPGFSRSRSSHGQRRWRPPRRRPTPPTGRKKNFPGRGPGSSSTAEALRPFLDYGLRRIAPDDAFTRFRDLSTAISVSCGRSAPACSPASPPSAPNCSRRALRCACWRR